MAANGAKLTKPGGLPPLLQMKFVESILSNNTTDDHCQEFVAQRGLRPLVTILGLPNLPVDFPTSAACQAVAGVCKSILVWGGERGQNGAEMGGKWGWGGWKWGWEGGKWGWRGENGDGGGKMGLSPPE